MPESRESRPTTAIIVVAAGSGTRLAQSRPKAFVEVGDRSILAHALAGIFGVAEELQVVVVAPAELVDEATAIAHDIAGVASASITVVAGGATRHASVAAGLAAIADGITTVLVHDSARAFTPVTQIEAVIAAVRSTGAGVIPGLAVADTIKRVDAGHALETIDRSQLVAVQTPQGFPRIELVAAYAATSNSGAPVEYTDDAALFTAAGHSVAVIDGDPLAFKITTPWDLRRAEALVGEALVGEAPAAAGAVEPAHHHFTGIGIDVHAYDEASPMWLGGLHFEGEPGLTGHSDGDAVAHAICDALLSAARLGDIGGRFGTDDPAFANARGEVFLRATVELLRAEGFAIENVAVQVVGNRPRLAKRRAEMEAHLTAIVGAGVSVSATTSDGLGFTGRGEGLAAIATALLRR